MAFTCPKCGSENIDRDLTCQYCHYELSFFEYGMNHKKYFIPFLLFVGWLIILELILFIKLTIMIIDL